ncbi:MAG: hypothetical protein Q4C85_06695 [Actinomyces sp.]|uniref:hypothetical protein n=1 Tax=Actinomyces sp. TaxID=29317 RepID=UPI0026DC0D9C|nr:hypothetical protein [Actinomyces sp.]MDO4243432.1 hypothetical protein [Actinomyces sp.]
MTLETNPLIPTDKDGPVTLLVVPGGPGRVYTNTATLVGGQGTELSASMSYRDPISYDVSLTQGFGSFGVKKYATGSLLSQVPAGTTVTSRRDGGSELARTGAAGCLALLPVTGLGVGTVMAVVGQDWAPGSQRATVIVVSE